MTIHHATKTRAAKFDIMLEANDEGIVTATTKRGSEIETNDAKSALNHAILAIKFELEYPNILVMEGRTRHVVDDEVSATILEFDPSSFDIDDVFASTLDLANEEGYDLGEPEEEERSGGVVPARYREEYKARGDENHCGDWLAVTLVEAFTEEGGKRKGFDYVGFRQCLIDNGVEMVGKWAELFESDQPGWQGRFRMNGRQKLEIAVAIAGILKIGGSDVKPDADWLEEMQLKHADKIPHDEE